MGEAVILGVDGISDFDALHSRQDDHEVHLYAFDCLAFKGDDLRRIPLHLRKTNLMQLLRGRSQGIFVAPFESGKTGPELFEAACRMGHGRRDEGTDGPCRFSCCISRTFISTRQEVGQPDDPNRALRSDIIKDVKRCGRRAQVSGSADRPALAPTAGRDRTAGLIASSTLPAWRSSAGPPARISRHRGLRDLPCCTERTTFVRAWFPSFKIPVSGK